MLQCFYGQKWCSLVVSRESSRELAKQGFKFILAMTLQINLTKTFRAHAFYTHSCKSLFKFKRGYT